LLKSDFLDFFDSFARIRTFLLVKNVADIYEIRMPILIHILLKNSS